MGISVLYRNYFFLSTEKLKKIKDFFIYADWGSFLKTIVTFLILHFKKTRCLLSLNCKKNFCKKTHRAFCPFLFLNKYKYIYMYKYIYTGTKWNKWSKCSKLSGGYRLIACEFLIFLCYSVFIFLCKNMLFLMIFMFGTNGTNDFLFQCVFICSIIYCLFESVSFC